MLMISLQKTTAETHAIPYTWELTYGDKAGFLGPGCLFKWRNWQPVLKKNVIPFQTKDVVVLWFFVPRRPNA